MKVETIKNIRDLRIRRTEVLQLETLRRYEWH